MPKVGELAGNNCLYQTARTHAKLDSTTNALMDGCRTVLGGSATPQQVELLRELLYSGLQWTADDVLTQAMEDGYAPTQAGVL